MPRMSLMAAAKWMFLLFVFALLWMKQPLIIGGLPAIPADLLFLLTALLWLAALVTREAKLSWDKAFWPLVIYFAALAVSAAFSTDPCTSAIKLATQLYLLSIPVLTYNLVQTLGDLKRVFFAYLAGVAIVSVLGAATILLFPLFGYHSFLAAPLHHFGTLPPGPYPRLELTFEYPAMMANYLAVGLMMAILSCRVGWMSQRTGQILAGGILLTAFFALTPGFGGLLFMLGVWFWHSRRRTMLGRLSLVAGIAAAGLEVAVAAVTPILHRTAPFLIDVAALPQPLAPAVRLLAWIDAWRNFLARPVSGSGIGTDAVHVPYASPEGAFGIVTDAHNMFLNLAAQAGLAGLIGILAIIVVTVRMMIRGADKVFGLGLAFLSCLVIQGLVGSFEDARHLWLAYGLMAAAAKLARDEPDARPSSA